MFSFEYIETRVK